LPHKKVIVLDRDGVINQDSPQFIKTPGEFIPIPGSIEAIASLGDAGFSVVIASNQSGVGRGLFDHNTLRSIHDKLIDLVEQAGGRLTGIYVCPHHPDAGCDCRKPLPGLLKRLAADLDVQPTELIVIGDSQRDLAAAAAVGARPVLVRTGNGKRTEVALSGDTAIEIFDDLEQAARHLINPLS
jgi:D-glycero-D-manno-heptose 1,7-bisphosphate phosphatase